MPASNVLLFVDKTDKGAKALVRAMAIYLGPHQQRQEPNIPNRPNWIFYTLTHVKYKIPHHHAYGLKHDTIRIRKKIYADCGYFC